MSDQHDSLSDREGVRLPTQFPTRPTRYRYALAGLGEVTAEVRV